MPWTPGVLLEAVVDILRPSLDLRDQAEPDRAHRDRKRTTLSDNLLPPTLGIDEPPDPPGRIGGVDEGTREIRVVVEQDRLER